MMQLSSSRQETRRKVNRMDPKELIPGLEFAKKYDLTQREILVLIPHLKKPMTSKGVAEALKYNRGSLHHIILRLKLKRLLILKDRNEDGSNILEFDKKTLLEKPSE